MSSSLIQIVMEEIMVEESELNWLESQLHEEPLLMQDEEVPLMEPVLEPLNQNHNSINFLASIAYSGPTIEDVESALSLRDASPGRRRRRLWTPELHVYNFSVCLNTLSPIMSMPSTFSLFKSCREGMTEKEELSKQKENKRTFRVKKASVNGAADDGYKWRKYGQKSIKNSPNPRSRSYYRCTTPRCNAKKQIEKSIEDPETIIVTYEGLHLHYAYPYILLSQKKNHWREKEVIQELISKDAITPKGQSSKENILRHQGMLEDVVPLMARVPYTSVASSNHKPFPSQ